MATFYRYKNNDLRQNNGFPIYRNPPTPAASKGSATEKTHDKWFKKVRWVSERQSQRLGGLSKTCPGGVLQWQGPTDQNLALPGWDEGLAVTAFAESWRWKGAFWRISGPFGELAGLFLASFFYPSEGYLRHWQVQAGGFARHSLCWCFGVAGPAFWKPFRGLWGLFLASFFYPSEGYLRHWRVQAGGFARHSLCWCFGVAGPAFWKPFRGLWGLFLASFFYPSEGYLRH